MKSFIKTFLAMGVAAGFFTACNKVDDLPRYGNGTAPVLTASATSIAPTAADSNSNVVVFSWTDAKFATDADNHKYVLEIDSAGRNFSRAARIEVLGDLDTTLTAKQLNNILLGFGFQFNVAYSVEARVVASYGNNNERLPSNVITMTVTPYKIPPRVPLPTSDRLFITGGGTYFDWTNPAPMPAVRELTRTDETTWEGIFHMRGSGFYLLLPVAGSWDNKYSVQDNSLPGASDSGPFGYNLPQDIPGSITGGDGWYKLVFDFQQGIYTATGDNPLSEDLYITGDATGSGWTNAPPPAQKLTQLTNGIFEIIVPLEPGKLYKFLNTNGQWQPQFGGNSATGGALGANYGSGSDPDAIPTPATAGNYKITVNFIDRTYTVVPQ